jgi:hypothetical protein
MYIVHLFMLDYCNSAGRIIMFHFKISGCIYNYRYDIQDRHLRNSRMVFQLCWPWSITVLAYLCARNIPRLFRRNKNEISFKHIQYQPVTAPSSHSGWCACSQSLYANPFTRLVTILGYLYYLPWSHGFKRN